MKKYRLKINFWGEVSGHCYQKGSYIEKDSLTWYGQDGYILPACLVENNPDVFEKVELSAQESVNACLLKSAQDKFIAACKPKELESLDIKFMLTQSDHLIILALMDSINQMSKVINSLTERQK